MMVVLYWVHIVAVSQSHVYSIVQKVWCAAQTQISQTRTALDPKLASNHTGVHCLHWEELTDQGTRTLP